MTNKVTLELNPNQVEELVERLSIEDKIRLVRKLENETWAKRLDEVVSKMRRKIKEVGITDKDIDHLCEEVKRDYNEKHHRR